MLIIDAVNGKKPTRILHFVTWVLGLCLLTNLPAYADAQREAILNEQRQLLADEIRKVEKQLRNDLLKRSKANRALEEIEKELAKLEGQRKKLSASDKELKQSLADLGKRRSELNQTISSQKALLAKLLRDAYIAGQQEKLALILNRPEVKSLGRVMDYQDYISEQRVDHINRMLTRQNELDSVEAELVQAREKSAATSADLKKTLDKANKQKAQRQKTLSKMSANVTESEQQIRRYKQQDEQLNNLLGQLQKAVKETQKKRKIAQKVKFSKLRGKLRWPVKGKRLNKYNDARAKGRLRWQGVMIAADRGDKVRAIAPGQVVFADWMGRLGLLIAIDHGEGYISIYAHNEAIYRNVGDWIAEGDVISTVGDSGGQERTATYFALRKYDRYRNPARWCKKRAKG